MRKRIISAFLALVLVLSLAPALSMPARASIGSIWPFQENPTWIEIDNKGVANGLRALKNQLGIPGGRGPLYIRLTSDLVYRGDSDFNELITVHGCKHLDLNGHEIVYGVDKRVGRDVAFITVPADSELHIYDSKGGGRIFYDGKLTGEDKQIERDLIRVKSGGAIFVNGGTLEAGRSKEIYSSWSEDLGDDFYTGNIVHLIGGTGLELWKGSKGVINGGRIYGRGQNEDAIRVSNASLIINGGYIKGYSGASALNVMDDSGSSGYYLINGGEFDTHKNERLLEDRMYTPFAYGQFYYGTYGYVIPPEDFDKVSFPANADVVISGEGGTRTSRQTMKVTPKDASLRLEHPGWDTFSPDASTLERKVYIDGSSFTPYFQGEEKWLKQDYDPKSQYYFLAAWQIFDTDGNAVSNIQTNQAQSFDTLQKYVDLHRFKGTDGVSPLALTEGKRYTLRCALQETWYGWDKEPVSQTGTAEFRFTASSFDQSRIQYKITSVQQVMGAPQFTLELTSEDQSGAYSDTLIGRSIFYGYEAQNGWMAMTYTLEENFRGRLTNLPVGKVTVMGCMTALDDRGVQHSFFDKRDVFVMPRIEYGTNEMGGYTTPDHNRVEISPDGDGTYPWVTLRAVSQDLLNAAGLRGQDVRWERFNEGTGKWDVITYNNTSGLRADKGLLELFDARSGLYRASLEYNGQRWYAVPVTVDGKDYTTSQRLTVTSDRTVMEVNKDYSADLTYAPVPASGDWGIRWYPGFIVYEGNVPQSFYEYIQDFASDSPAMQLEDGGFLVSLSGNGSGETPKTFKLNQAAPILLKPDAMVPGNYTLVPCVKIERFGGGYYPLVKADPITLEVVKRVESVDILADGENVTQGLGTSVDNAPKVVMRENTKNMNLDVICSPDNASDKRTFVAWESSDLSVANVDEGGYLTATQPGTTIITMHYTGHVQTGSGTEYNRFTRYIKVVVPIAEVEFSAPDWSQLVGKPYNKATLNVTRVRSYGGLWQNAKNYVQNEVFSLSRYGYASFSKSPSDLVEYNDSCYVYFTLTAKPGYQFPLKPTGPSCKEFIANDLTLKTTCLDDPTVMNTAFQNGYDAINSSGYRWYPEDDAYGVNYEAHRCGIYVRAAIPCLEDPNAVYLDTVAIEAAEPQAGDLRYSGAIPASDAEMAGWSPDDMMGVRILTMFGQKAANGSDLLTSSSHVFKLTTPLKGDGASYTPLAEGEYNQSNYGTEWVQAICDSNWKADRNKLQSARYTYGSYGHELKLYTGVTGADGKNYYFSPDVRVLVNGKEVQVVTPEGENGYGTSRLTIGYYYTPNDARPPLVTGTISGLNAPVTGAMPQTGDQLTATATNTDSVTTDKAYVSGLIWFIDKNGNKVLDEGEQCTPGNGLSADGRFLGETQYSALLVLNIQPEDGRISSAAFTLNLNLDGVSKSISTTQPQGVYTFPKTEAATGVTVSGQVESFNSGTDPVTIQLIEQGASEAAYEVEVSPGTQSGSKYTASYSFSDIPSGSYTMKVMKKGHAPWTETITVGVSNITDHMVTLYQWGDVNGDGSVNAADAQEILRNTAGLSSVFDTNPNLEYCMLRADVTCDGSVNAADAQEILRNAAGLSSVISNLP